MPLLSRRGVTVIEIMIVLVLMTMLGSFAYPKIRTISEHNKVRSARFSINSAVITARAASAQRSCTGTVNFSITTVWVTACPRLSTTGTGTVDTLVSTVITKRYSVTFTTTRSTITFDPTGISPDNVAFTAQITGTQYGFKDSVTVNEIGRVTH